MATECNLSKRGSKAAFNTAFITAATIFIMGYVNGLALHTSQINAMVTAQSGNIVWLGLNPAFGYWSAFLGNIALLFGFVFGCGFAIMTLDKFKKKGTQFAFNWALFALPVALYPFYMQFINTHIAFLLMGLSSGFGVGFFRRMYHIDQMNNAMASGSVRFLGVHFAGGFLKKNKEELFTLWIFVIAVAMFSFGAAAFAFAASADYSLGILAEPIARDFAREYAPLLSVTNITLIVLCIIPCFFAKGSFGTEGE